MRTLFFIRNFLDQYRRQWALKPTYASTNIAPLFQHLADEMEAFRLRYRTGVYYWQQNPAGRLTAYYHRYGDATLKVDMYEDT